MKKMKIQKVTEPITYIGDVRSFGVIGDPGCDGLGTQNMKVYAGALEQTAKDELTLVVGDLVPEGTKKYYEDICTLTEVVAENHVYGLRGNHDTGAYTECFGLHNYALVAKRFALIVIDNAKRCFEEEGLRLVEQVLAMDEVEQAVIAFHIPLPNHFIQNAVSEEEFDRLKAAYSAEKSKVKYLLCGHVHSWFVDEVDGITMICTGGGGAMIEDVSEHIRACDINHHVVHFYLEKDALCYRVCDLAEDCYPRERKSPVLKSRLEETITGELMAHFKYLLFADRAKRRGFDRVANLFEALADSEYRHAKNFYSVLERPAAFMEAIEGFIPTEQFEYKTMYKMMADYARQTRNPLTVQAYTGAAAAEKVHAELLKEAADIEDFQTDIVYVCPICGFVMAGEDVPDRCAVCGAPKKQYLVFKAEE